MSGERVTAGVYRGRAIAGSAQYAVAKSGNETIALDLELDGLGRFTTILYFSDAAAPHALGRLRACGWAGDDVTDLAGIDSAEVDVRVAYETYEGKERMKVEIVTVGGRVKLENPMDEKQRHAFAARMKAFVKGAPLSGARPASPARAPAPAQRSMAPVREPWNSDGPPPDDDIPF